MGVRPQIINQHDTDKSPDIDNTQPLLLWRWADVLDWEEFPDLEVTDKAVLIEEMLVPKEQRKQGEGTKLITLFIKRFGNNIILGQAYPFDPDPMVGCHICRRVRPTDEAFREKRRQLIKWYNTFGFVHVDGGWLYRLPTRKGGNGEARKSSSSRTRDDRKSRILNARSHHAEG